MSIDGFCQRCQGHHQQSRGGPCPAATYALAPSGMLAMPDTVPPALDMKATDGATTRGMFDTFSAVWANNFRHSDTDILEAMECSGGGVYARVPSLLQPLQRRIFPPFVLSFRKFPEIRELRPPFLRIFITDIPLDNLQGLA